MQTSFLVSTNRKQVEEISESEMPSFLLKIDERAPRFGKDLILPSILLSFPFL